MARSFLSDDSSELWQLPAFSAEALQILDDPGSTREEKERVWSEHLDEEAYDLLTGQTRSIRELLRSRGGQQFDADQPEDEIGRPPGAEVRGE